MEQSGPEPEAGACKQGVASGAGIQDLEPARRPNLCRRFLLASPHWNIQEDYRSSDQGLTRAPHQGKEPQLARSEILNKVKSRLMRMRMFYQSGATLCLVSGLVLTTSGCKNLPGTPGEQGAGIGGVSGAAVGAAVGGEHHRLLGALVGGAVGAGGGYLIGANKDRITGHDTAAAQEAVQRAQANPATPQQALSAPTADLNGDGFVTIDEVVAMKRAGLSDEQMLQRLQATGQVFELSPQQQEYLRSNGVDDYIIGQMPEINRQVRNQLLAQPGYPAPTANPAYPGTTTIPSYPTPPSNPSYPPPAVNPGLNQPVPPPPGP